jgi:hypothetical protein
MSSPTDKTVILSKIENYKIHKIEAVATKRSEIAAATSVSPSSDFKCKNTCKEMTDDFSRMSLSEIEVFIKNEKEDDCGTKWLLQCEDVLSTKKAEQDCKSCNSVEKRFHEGLAETMIPLPNELRESILNHSLIVMNSSSVPRSEAIEAFTTVKCLIMYEDCKPIADAKETVEPVTKKVAPAPVVVHTQGAMDVCFWTTDTLIPSFNKVDGNNRNILLAGADALDVLSCSDPYSEKDLFKSKVNNFDSKAKMWEKSELKEQCSILTDVKKTNEDAIDCLIQAMEKITCRNDKNIEPEISCVQSDLKTRIGDKHAGRVKSSEPQDLKSQYTELYDPDSSRNPYSVGTKLKGVPTVYARKGTFIG